MKILGRKLKHSWRSCCWLLSNYGNTGLCVCDVQAIVRLVDASFIQFVFIHNFDWQLQKCNDRPHAYIKVSMETNIWLSKSKTGNDYISTIWPIHIRFYFWNKLIFFCLSIFMNFFYFKGSNSLCKKCFVFFFLSYEK